MLQPKRVKWRKHQRGKRRGAAKGGARLEFGVLGLKATSNGWVTSRQIEAARRAIVHYLARGGDIWIRVFPDKAVSARPAETRMGGGKGATDHWVATVKRGRILFEIAGVPENMGREALRRATFKLPVSTIQVSRDTEL